MYTGVRICSIRCPLNGSPSNYQHYVTSTGRGWLMSKAFLLEVGLCNPSMGAWILFVGTIQFRLAWVLGNV